MDSSESDSTENVEVPLGISKGDKYSSYEEINNAIDAVSIRHFVQFFIRDSRRIEIAKKRVKRPMQDELIFYQIKYSCIRGGQKYSCKGKGIRSSRTFRKKNLCPAHINFTISEAGNDFEVTSISNIHNHLVSEAHSEVRRLRRDVRKMAASNVSSDEILTKATEVPEISGDLETPVKSEDVDKLEIDLSIKCRGCFVEDPEMHYLFTVFDQELSLADILMQTTQFVCKEDDGFPPYLCTKCTTCLIDFFNFKIQFQKTEIYVRTLLGNSIPTSLDVVTVKNEAENVSDGGSDVDDSVPEESCDNAYDIEETRFMPDIKVLSGTTLQCEQCDLDFKSPDECETHMARDHGKNPFTKFHLFRKLIAENERALIEARKKRRFLEADLREQILMNMPGKLCRICRKKFSEEEFKSHWESHKIHVCEVCGHKCIKKSDLDIHKQSVHNDVRNFNCLLCDKSFKTKQLLKRHQIVHLNPRAFCCDLCGQRFNDSGTLKTHIQLKHIGNRDFICPICGLAFPMKATLDKHILRHNKNRPPSFYCDICASAFKDKSSLKRHHLVKHSSDYVRPACEHCGKTYCSNTKLRYHIERHHSGNKVERKKRGPKKIKVEEYGSSENSGSEESSGSSEESPGQGPKVQNVDANFYRNRSYPARRPDDPGYFGYTKTEYESEEESQSNSESE